jgi:hypothetical protein
MSTGKIEGRRKTFAEKIAEGHTATEAYLLAGYRPAKRETAHRAASRLYSNPGVRAYIRELRRTGDELAREETTLTIARKLTFLARLVLTSSATLREDDPLIQSHRILKDGTASIRMPCKLKALKMHSELAGHFLPEPADQTPPADPLQELFDQIRRGHYRVGDPLAGRNTEPSDPVATGLEARRDETRDQARNEPEAPQFVPTGTNWPSAPKQASSANLPADQTSKPLPTTTNRDPLTERDPEPRVEDPLAGRNIPDKPLTPLQVRKAIIAQLQQSSPIRHLYQTEAVKTQAQPGEASSKANFVFSNTSSQQYARNQG